MIRLPIPPSTNHLFANTRSGRVKSREYKAWIGHAGWELRTQPRASVMGQVSLRFLLPFNARRDASNYIKPLEDLLVTHRMIEGDSMKYVRRIVVDIHDQSFVGVEIEPFSQTEAA